MSILPTEHSLHIKGKFSDGFFKYNKILGYILYCHFIFMVYYIFNRFNLLYSYNAICK